MKKGSLFAWQIQLSRRFFIQDEKPLKIGWEKKIWIPKESHIKN